jgi:hypothetical protein
LKLPKRGINMNEKEIVKFRITSVAEPTQIEGRLSNGNNFYIRYRGGNYYFEEYDKCMQTGNETVGEKMSKSIFHPENDSFMTVYQAFDVANLKLTDRTVMEIARKVKPLGLTWVKVPFMKSPYVFQEEE